MSVTESHVRAGDPGARLYGSRHHSTARHHRVVSHRGHQVHNAHMYANVHNSEEQVLFYVYIFMIVIFIGRARRCRLPQDPCSVGGVVTICRDPEDPHANQGGNLHCTYRSTISIVTWLSTWYKPCFVRIYRFPRIFARRVCGKPSRSMCLCWWVPSNWIPEKCRLFPRSSRTRSSARRSTCKFTRNLLTLNPFSILHELSFFTRLVAFGRMGIWFIIPCA